MKHFRDMPIRTKLNLLLGATTGLALMLACLTFCINDVVMIRSSTVTRLSAVADVVGANTAAAISFNDRRAAVEALASLRHEPIVQFACVYDRKGQPFAQYRRAGFSNARRPPAVSSDGHRFTAGGLEIFKPVSDVEERVGSLYLLAGMEHLHSQVVRSTLLAAAVLITAFVVSLLLASGLQRFVASPIVQLAGTAQRISQERDYSLRVEKRGNDEVGALYDEFNQMLSQIEAGEHELRAARDELEVRVQERTRQLSQAIEDLQRENAERHRAEEDLRALQQEHIAAAHRIGMAEVATSVLHNVGNVLNSINISATVIANRIRKSGVSDLRRATECMQQNLADLARYVTEDRRGQHLPRFLIQLSAQMAADQRLVEEELELLAKYVQHVKEIVSVQQSHACTSGLIEEVRLSDLIEDAIRINSASTQRHDIETVRDFEDLPPVMLEKHKVLQILVNLISNAKYALMETSREHRRMIVQLARHGDRIRISVTDNGIGIPPENLTRIFAHGFTTRKDGHGFGLHSAALAADDLNGTLTAFSEGAGRGATFTLELPCSTAEVKACTALVSTP